VREIDVKKITETVADLCIKASYDLPQDVLDALNEALARETSPDGREIIRELLKNAEIAKKEKLPICQDTGYAVVFIEIGQDIHLAGGDIHEAINEGVSLGYKDLRKSIVNDPLLRKNTNDNTPASVHLDIVPGDKIKIAVLPKGGGGENASAMAMLLPTALKDDIIKYVVDHAVKAAPKACAPGIVGVGIGGTFDTVGLLAKKALVRQVNRRNSNHDIAELEKEILKRINASGAGPMGLGGLTTALAVHIETAPCHIASLPVAVNMQCHAHRYKEAVI